MPENRTVMWTVEGNSFLHEIDYKIGLMTMRQDGYYFLYSNIALSVPTTNISEGELKHMVIKTNYSNKSEKLMVFKRYIPLDLSIF